MTSPLTTTRITPRTFYRVVAIAEAVTWTLLIAGLLLKYVFDAGDLGVRVGGSIHGFVFLTYGMTGVLVGVNQHWPVARIAFAALTAVVPYATIPFDRWLERNNFLDGGWRRTETEDPRDRSWVSRLLRWFLNHPVILSVLFMVGVLAVFTVLLIIGPPGGRQ